MDPNRTLEDLRSLIHELEDCLRQSQEIRPPIASQIVERFNDLDDWLVRGGFPPSDWRGP